MTESEQQHLIGDTASRSTKRQDMLQIWGRTWPLWTPPGCAYGTPCHWTSRLSIFCFQNLSLLPGMAVELCAVSFCKRFGCFPLSLFKTHCYFSKNIPHKPTTNFAAVTNEGLVSTESRAADDDSFWPASVQLVHAFERFRFVGNFHTCACAQEVSRHRAVSVATGGITPKRSLTCTKE